ncbi:MAG: tRNA preQ1(34) S-adenosylmethionine ribosyltransferase-isomerase QueA [Cyanobacteriota bacterium]
MDTNLLKNSYFYELPESSIATKPIEPRDLSKLMVINRKENTINHNIFKNIGDYLQKGDLIVLNDTRVIPARLFGIKEKTGAKLEVFLVREIEKDTWLTLVKPAKRLKEGDKIVFNEDLSGETISYLETGERIIKFSYPNNKTFMQIIKELGEVPFPPYIKKPDCNSERYQTVYSKNEGSVAAPTAGLHFTKELIDSLIEKQIKFEYITLHVGLGTFLPVKEELITNHKMHKEYYELSEKTAQTLNYQKENNKRIISVGTTVTRVLETIYNKYGKFKAESDFSEIFIYPPNKVKATDILITNFHLPESTLLMLISAFWDREKVLSAYQLAIEKDYKFYSFGDSMIFL